MNKILQTLRNKRPWIAFIDDERHLGNSIIVTLADRWCFVDDPGCGVMGFDTIAETRSGTMRNRVQLKEI